MNECIDPHSFLPRACISQGRDRIIFEANKDKENELEPRLNTRERA
jgi:hypothetical protein